MEPAVDPILVSPHFTQVYEAINQRELGPAYRLAIQIRTQHGDAEFQSFPIELHVPLGKTT